MNEILQKNLYSFCFYREYPTCTMFLSLAIWSEFPLRDHRPNKDIWCCFMWHHLPLDLWEEGPMRKFSVASDKNNKYTTETAEEHIGNWDWSGRYKTSNSYVSLPQDTGEPPNSSSVPKHQALHKYTCRHTAEASSSFWISNSPRRYFLWESHPWLWIYTGQLIKWSLYPSVY